MYCRFSLGALTDTRGRTNTATVKKCKANVWWNKNIQEVYNERFYKPHIDFFFKKSGCIANSDQTLILNIPGFGIFIFGES